jgi:hypothetical protein
MSHRRGVQALAIYSRIRAPCSCTGLAKSIAAFAEAINNRDYKENHEGYDGRNQPVHLAL